MAIVILINNKLCKFKPTECIAPSIYSSTPLVLYIIQEHSNQANLLEYMCVGNMMTNKTR